MITASNIFSDVRSFLDDDNSGRYGEQTDLVPALNKAVGYLVTVFNSAFEAKKLSPEVLRDLSVTKVLPVTGTTTKKCDLSSITDLWTVLSVSPDPTVTGSPETFSDTKHLSASRLTLEQWDNSSVDPFSPGSGVSIAADFVRAAYIGPGQYLGDGKSYLMMRPGSVFTADKVAIFYLKNPSRVATGASIIELPQSIYNLLVDKTINYLSLQHGPDSVYNKVTDKEVSQLVSLMIS
jgi:hypothetical protein